MNTNIITFSVTDLRHKTSQILKSITDNKLVYLLRHSKPEVAIVNIDYLTALQKSYEDYLDVLEFDRTVNLKRIPLEEHKKRKNK
jgi:PHD/YefM family antitoxin component YafN of YafNO toxin-antitoxin module